MRANRQQTETTYYADRTFSSWEGEPLARVEKAGPRPLTRERAIHTTAPAEDLETSRHIRKA